MGAELEPVLEEIPGVGRCPRCGSVVFSRDGKRWYCHRSGIYIPVHHVIWSPPDNGFNRLLRELAPLGHDALMVLVISARTERAKAEGRSYVHNPAALGAMTRDGLMAELLEEPEQMDCPRCAGPLVWRTGLGVWHCPACKVIYEEEDEENAG